MTYDSLHARSSSRLEKKKKLGYGAFVASFFLVMTTCIILKLHWVPIMIHNLQLPAGTDQTMKVLKDISSSLQMPEAAGFSKIQLMCNMTGRSDFCDIKGDVRVDGNSATVFIVSSSQTEITAAASKTSRRIRPYARKESEEAMSYIREWKVKLLSNSENAPQCNRYQNLAAILFSFGGYAGNHFRAFTDVLIPLYATARPFNGDVQLLFTDKMPWRIAKFKKILKALSGQEIVDIDKSNDIHCFPSIVVGLKARSKKELSIDGSNSADSMKDFRQFLRSTYLLSKLTAIKIRDVDEKTRPRLLIISRQRSRTFTNVGEIALMARRLGYEALVEEPDADVQRFAQLMNSCDVVMGVHGAGLTNMVFLPDNAILIQVVPIGTEWVSWDCFEVPASDMNIRYLEHKIRKEESTLIEQYPAGHVVFTDPSSIQKKDWAAFRAIYFHQQNVRLDVNRFRPTLLKALELLQQ